MYFQDTLLLPGKAATKSSYEPAGAARGNGFQLPGSNTQREEQELSNKFSASILQTFEKIIS